MRMDPAAICSPMGPLVGTQLSSFSKPTLSPYEILILSVQYGVGTSLIHLHPYYLCCSPALSDTPSPPRRPPHSAFLLPTFWHFWIGGTFCFYLAAQAGVGNCNQGGSRGLPPSTARSYLVTSKEAVKCIYYQNTLAY